MNRLSDRELETTIREALAERAAMITPTVRSVDPVTIRQRRSPWRPRLAVAGFALLAFATIVGVGLWIGRDDSSTSRVSSGQLVDGHEEVLLHEVPITTELRSALVAQGFDFGTDADPVAVRPDGHRPLLVLATSPIIPAYTSPQAPTIQGCVAIATPAEEGFGQPSRSCFQSGSVAPPAGIPRFNTFDLHADARDRLAYFTWTDVPRGATRVTYDSKDLHAWQVPIRGVAVFPTPVDQGATVCAFAADGRLLGEQIVEAPEFPSEGYVGPNPAWYDLDANLRFCKDAPLDQVDFVVGGDHGRFRLAVIPGGTADVDAREYCTQMMALRPEPQGAIRSSTTVVNGDVVITHYRLIDPNISDVPGNETNRQAVPDEELRAINSARRAEVTPICKSKTKASFEIPACQVGG